MRAIYSNVPALGLLRQAAKLTLLTSCSVLTLSSAGWAQDNTPDITLNNGDPDFTTAGDSNTSGVNSPNILAEGFNGTIVVRAGDTLTSTGDNDNMGNFPSGGIIAQDTNGLSATITIVNSGTISHAGAGSLGIGTRDIENVDITNSGTIQTSGGSSVNLRNVQSGAFKNSGTITISAGATGVLASNSSLDITNEAGATIETNGPAVDAILLFDTTDTNVSNAGTISTTDGNGVFVNGGTGAVVHNQQGGSISVSGLSRNGIQASNTSNLTIINDGTITTDGVIGSGIVTANLTSGTIRNGETGTITTTGVAASGITGLSAISSIENAGLINTQGDDGSGIALQSSVNSTVTNEETGEIITSGARANGIGNFGTASLTTTITNDGAIDVIGSEANGILNQGFDQANTINSTTGEILVAGDDAHGISVTSGNTSTIQNDGLIEVTGANGFGIRIGDLTSGSQTTNGANGAISATSTTGEGVVYTATTGDNALTNDGTITATVNAVRAGDSNESIVNNGTLSGNVILGGGTDTISNSGTINGDIDLGAGDDSFEYRSGSANGAVDGGSGSDTVVFTVTASDAAQNVDGSAFTNVETADHSAGGDLTLAFNSAVGFNNIVVGANSNLTLQNAQGTNVTTTVDAGGSLTVDATSSLSNTNAGGTVVSALGDSITVANEGSLSATGTDGTAIALANGTNTVTNFGSINATGLAISGGSGNDSINNAGTITGDAQLGAGDDELVLAASAQYNGTVDFGDGNDTLIFDVPDGNSRTIDRANFDPFNNLERLEKFGNGALFINAGTTADVGSSFIHAGLFQVDGVFNSNVFIDASALLIGDGQIGGDATVAGGYSAGSGLGQTTIDGNLTLNDTSVFFIDLNSTDADLSLVGGSAVFQNGALVLVPDGQIVSDTGSVRYEVVRTQGGVTDNFSTIDTGGIGRALVFVEGNSLFVEVITQIGDGEVYTTTPAINTTSALTVIDSLNGQLVDRRGVENGRLDLWVTSLDDFARYHGELATDTSDYNIESHGVMAGFGYGLTDEVTIGAFVGYQNLDQDFSSIIAESNGDNIFFGLYGIADYGRLNLNGALAYHASDLESSRFIAPLGLRAYGHYDTEVFTAHSRIGYEILSNDTWFVEPYAGIAYIAADRQTFEERGANAANLEVLGGTTHFAYLDLGTRISGGLFGGSLIPHISAAWRYDLVDDDNSVTQRFLSGGDYFTVPGADLERSRLAASAGFLAYLTETFSIYATYDGEFGDALTSHGFRAGFSYKF
ncbi:MAG: autotransporter domain-containing protein [Sphingomonadales bacterium]|jgi:uncharacterized protein with beta-barrel porin domain